MRMSRLRKVIRPMYLPLSAANVCTAQIGPPTRAPGGREPTDIGFGNMLECTPAVGRTTGTRAGLVARGGRLPGRRGARPFGRGVPRRPRRMARVTGERAARARRLGLPRAVRGRGRGRQAARRRRL